MLDPHDRQLFLESLRPPEGYALDCAIGTTFSLDLAVLLTAQLAFTWFDWQEEDGRPVADPLALLEAVRRNADRIAVFCQAGEIAVPRRHQLLYGYLEGSVFEVLLPTPAGTFHPKVWVLRFTAAGVPTRYRVLCMTRNLTFDRSWDSILSLEGDVQNRERGIGASRPLGEFIVALPRLARRPLAASLLTRIDQVAGEVRRVRFEPPEGFDDVRFWPLGIDGARRWPFDTRIDRMLVISPFLSSGCLAQLAEQGTGHILVSRLDALQSLNPEALQGFPEVYFLSPEASVVEEDTEDAEDADSEGKGVQAGLHAKLYVADAGWDAHVWTGSANATVEAFRGNVELLVELRGRKSVCGVDAVLGRADRGAGIGPLLQPYEPLVEATAADPVEERLEQRLRDAKRALAEQELTAYVSQAGEPQAFRIRLSCPDNTLVKFPAGLSGRCWPISLREDAAAAQIATSTAILAKFGPVSFEGLTSFFAFELRATEGLVERTSQFVLNVRLEGAPADRQEDILHSLLRNRDDVIRLLLLILAEGGLEGIGVGIPTLTGTQGGGRQALGRTSTVFEALVRALDRDPVKLDQIARIVEDLRKTPKGRDLLPEEFDAVWEPIWNARQRLRRVDATSADRT